MVRDKLYPAIAAGVVVFAALIFLLGPEKEKRSGSVGELWNRNWKKIEYISGSAKGNESVVLLREGLLQPEFFVVEKDARFPAGSVVENIFRDWRKPGVRGAYRKEGLDLAQYGINDDSPKILLYQSESESPLEVVLGDQKDTGGTFAILRDEQFEEELFLLSTSLFSRFRTSIIDYRERRVVAYQGGEKPVELKVTFDQGGKTRTLELFHHEKKEKNGNGVLDVWRTKDGLELSRQTGQSLKSSLDRVRVDLFYDEYGIARDEIEKKWEDAKNEFLSFTIKMDRGKLIHARIRKPGSEILQNNRVLHLMKTQSIDPPAWTYAEGVYSVQRSAIQAVHELKQKQNEKTKPEPPGARPQPSDQ